MSNSSITGLGGLADFLNCSPAVVAFEIRKLYPCVRELSLMLRERKRNDPGAEIRNVYPGNLTEEDAKCDILGVHIDPNVDGHTGYDLKFPFSEDSLRATLAACKEAVELAAHPAIQPRHMSKILKFRKFLNDVLFGKAPPREQWVMKSGYAVVGMAHMGSGTDIVFQEATQERCLNWINQNGEPFRSYLVVPHVTLEIPGYAV